MYQREISVPMDYRRPVKALDPLPPARRGKRRRRRHRRPARVLTILAVLLLGVRLTTAFKASPTAPEADPVLPLTAPVYPAAEEPQPNSTAEDWALTLVNPWNAIPEDYTVTLKELSNGHAVDERCYPALQEMLDACRAAGLSPLICSSYRSQEKQESLFQNKVDRLIAQGYTKENAATEAGKSVAIPGTSEHQLGLAVDIVGMDNQNLDSSQETTAVQQWLIAHSWEYGFILRYPSDKRDITGIIYEPWHYRYVGKTAAADIHTQGICLEEYLETA